MNDSEKRGKEKSLADVANVNNKGMVREKRQFDNVCVHLLSSRAKRAMNSIAFPLFSSNLTYF